MNGVSGTLRELQVGRARAVERLMIERNIDPSRIRVGPGSQGDADSNRNVGVVIR